MACPHDGLLVANCHCREISLLKFLLTLLGTIRLACTQ